MIAKTRHSRIHLDPKILHGKSVVPGARLSVEFVIGLRADGWSESAILENYPGLTSEDVRARLACARDAPATEKVYPSVSDALLADGNLPGGAMPSPGLANPRPTSPSKGS
jgi:uncharacterized protein (DUF433 family)